MIYIHPKLLELWAFQEVVRYFMNEGYMISNQVMKSGRNLLVARPVTATQRAEMEEHVMWLNPKKQV